MNGAGRVRVGWRLFCAALGLLLLFRIALALVGFRRLTWLFPARTEGAPQPYAARVAAAVHAASRFLPGATCLVQACAALVLIGGRGYCATLRVGVRKDSGGKMVAHAWLLTQDCVILGANAED